MNLAGLLLSILSGALAIAIGAGMIEVIRGIRHIYRRLEVIEQVLHIGNGWKVPSESHHPG